MPKYFYLLLLLAVSKLEAQPVIYTTANIHAHNDYDHNKPFDDAYALQLGSVEADVLLIHDTLFVAHSSKEINAQVLLGTAYLKKINDAILRNRGTVYANKKLVMQLLIDIKTDMHPTLDAVIKSIRQFPALLNNSSLKIVITGNQPAADKFNDYPAGIYFDGKTGDSTHQNNLQRIGLFSDDFSKYSKWNGIGNIPEKDLIQIKNTIQFAHAKHKAIRFWAVPDNQHSWETMVDLGVDFINTDHIQLAAHFIQSPLPNVFLFDPKRIGQIRQKMDRGDTTTKQLSGQVIAEAERLMKAAIGTVTAKSAAPPSGDKHDYMSLAPYFWPDSSKPDGLPYMRKDGQRNPMIDRITDKKYLVDMGKNTHTLALAWAFTGDERYARKVAEYIKKWFIDTATKMNPHLNYAQAVPGVNDGRGIGIIETIALTSVVDAMGILQYSSSLQEKERASVKEWFSNYLQWMKTSKNGKEERKALNNHGIWYDMQLLSFSLFLDDTPFVKKYTDSILLRIPVQIEPDGRQPLELERTTALGYSTFCLEAWFKTALLAQRAGVDIWHYQTRDGRSIQKALDWLLPYAMQEKKWEYQQIKEYTERDKLFFLISTASRNYAVDAYVKAYDKLSRKNSPEELLLYGIE
ncbi:MAG: hypothetical protein RLZZ28_2358 [Bacteroidota bacterium]